MKKVIPQSGPALFVSVHIPAHLFQQVFLRPEPPVEGGQAVERGNLRRVMVRENIPMLDRSCVPSAVIIAVQSLKTAAIPVVPDFQNDSMAHRRGRTAVYGHDIARLKGDRQIQITVC